jgi:hypothetical protein
MIVFDILELMMLFWMSMVAFSICCRALAKRKTVRFDKHDAHSFHRRRVGLVFALSATVDIHVCLCSVSVAKLLSAK